MGMTPEAWITSASSPARPLTTVSSSTVGREENLLHDARVLVVEDEFLVAALLQDRLIDLGCDVVGPASSIEEALALIEAAAIDAAVLDVNIAGRMVFPVADALTERHIPFVFATAYGASGLAPRHATRTVLEKPYQERELVRAICDALSHARG